MNYADLEIGLHHRDAESFALELRFTPFQAEADVQPGAGVLALDLATLTALGLDASAYGLHLRDRFFADRACERAFSEAQAAAAAAGSGLRVRISVGSTAVALHAVRWETMRGPDGSPLFTGERVLLSRYVTSSDWSPLRPKVEPHLRSLVLVANPRNIADYRRDNEPLAELDALGELARARAGVGGSVTSLATPGEATLANLTSRLSAPHDVVYLVCHGALIKQDPVLYLESASGDTEVVPGHELVARLRNLRERPRLVVLASCQSAGDGGEARARDHGALATLGPQLTEAGIPAVVGMQGDVTLETASRFLAVLFQELQRDGVVDRAVSVAREAVRDRDDWWMPVLFMRLKTGRLWYKPGFGDEHDFERWPSLLAAIRSRDCVPIVGPGLTDPIMGSRRDFARALADASDYPMALQDREDLPQVAQFIAVNQSRQFLERSVMERACDEMAARNEGLPAELTAGSTRALDDRGLAARFSSLVAAAWRTRAATAAPEPHAVLARLPFRLYVTTNPDALLETALVAAGKTDPFVNLCPWNENVVAATDETLGFDALLPERPLVYHLFGCVAQPDSLVLTEDDYFEFLLKFKMNQRQIPSAVLRGLTDKALLFLGFRLDDWNFRVLFRSIMSQEGGRRRNRFAHIAVQIDPEDGRVEEPELARRYLKKYFGEARIDIYWGNVDDFMAELNEHWASEVAAAPPAGGG